MELLHNFGFDPVLFGAQIVNFLIIFFILKRFLYKPVLEMLKKRKDAIKQGLQDAEAARLKLEDVAKKEKEILRSAQTESSKIIEEAKRQSTLILVEAEKNAKIQADRTIKEANQRITEEAKKTEKILMTKVSNLAIDFLQKSLVDLFSRETQEEVVKRAIKKLKGKTN